MSTLIFRLKKHRWFVGISVLMLIIVLWLSGAFHHSNSKVTPVVVQATQVKIQPMPLAISAHGTIESQQSVTITPQITGTITKIAFHSGKRVKEGQLLFEIDPATAMANLQQAEALLKRDKALFVSQEADANRYAELVKLEYVTKQQYDQTKAAANAQAALVNSDEAAVKQAKIQLGYTKIFAPVSGKTGEVTLRIGDLVTANSTTAMVKINQLDPLWVDFTIPQRQLPSLLQYKRQNKADKNQKLAVEVFSEDGKHLLGNGHLAFIDNNVNPQTGTVLLKAEVPNAKELLWPGLMVKTNLILTTEAKAIVVPMKAIQVGQEGNFVYQVIDHKAVSTPVTVDRQVDDLAVISKGLRGNETILTVIPPNMTDDVPVKISEANE